MNRFICIIFIVMTFLMFFQVFPLRGLEIRLDSKVINKHSDETVIKKSDLLKILLEHKKWFETRSKEGKRAKLKKGNLKGADLKGAFLRYADLSRADLSRANLSKSDLRGALLGGADLREADLSQANLKGAFLQKAKLGKANLKMAQINEADLSGADLSKADLSRADLRRADLSRADLRRANLRGANLSEAILSSFLPAPSGLTFLRTSEAEDIELHIRTSNSIDLRLKELSRTEPVWFGADIRKANLSKAKLKKANLRGANLRGAYLNGADLSGAVLEKAQLYDVDMNDVLFEPKIESLSHVRGIEFARNLSELRFNKFLHSLIELHKIFKKAGLRKQELEIIHAIKHTQRKHLRERGGLSGRIESVINLLFFEWTCAYGMKPGRSLIILVALIPFFSFLYIFALKTKKQKNGIWLIFTKERVLKKIKEERPFKLTAKFPPRALATGKRDRVKLKVSHWYRMVRISLYFSMISAFSIGWRDLNVGNWITRLQRQDYIFRATGWVRTVSGVQSLLSVYLLAISVITYFSRPFEAI